MGVPFPFPYQHVFTTPPEVGLQHHTEPVPVLGIEHLAFQVPREGGGGGGGGEGGGGGGE